MSINLDDSDDDLDLPPPPANGGNNNHKDPISLDTDDDDDLPPPGAGGAESLVLAPKDNKTVDLDDDDDDLPPPTRSVAPPTQTAAGKTPVTSPTTTANAAAKAPATTPAAASKTATPAPAAGAAAAANRDRGATVMKAQRRTISDTSMEGYLFKQSPTWPHSLQKRWVTLKGRLLSYYEEKTSTAPAGTIDLKGAQIIDNPQTKSPHALGITGDTPSLKGRTFIFTASSRDEYLGWLEVLKFVTTEAKSSEIHWFEKMAQGLY